MGKKAKRARKALKSDAGRALVGIAAGAVGIDPALVKTAYGISDARTAQIQAGRASAAEISTGEGVVLTPQVVAATPSSTPSSDGAGPIVVEAKSTPWGWIAGGIAALAGVFFLLFRRKGR